MEQRMDLVTLGVADVATARHFYVDGLGWNVVFEVPGDIVFLQVNHGLLLALFGAEDLAADAGTNAADSDSAGPDSAGPDSAGPDTAGPDTAGPDTAGSDTAGSDSGSGGGTGGGPSMSLAQVVATEDEVRAVCEQARAAGATVLKEPQHADFGGYHCYFADPSGFRWEVATNSGWHVSPDGRVTLGPIAT